MNEVEFEEMIQIHGPDLLRFCRMYAVGIVDGDELYQDTLLKLWEKRDVLDKKASIKSYAVSVAIRLGKNKRRKSAWRNRIAPQTSYEQMLESGDAVDDAGTKADPLDEILADEKKRLIRNCVEDLSEKYRQIVYMYYTADLSTSEIASCLHLSQNTVKTRLSRARVILKDRLEESINE